MIIVPTNTPRVTSGGDPYFPNVRTLLTGEGSNGSTTIVDRSPLGANWTANGTARISTTQSKWGGSSILFDGNGYLTAPAPSSQYTLDNNFTIEWWVNPQQLQGLMTDFRGGTYFEIGISGGKFYFVNPGVGGFNYFSPTLGINTWYHVAVTRSGGLIRAFCNGVLGATLSSSTAIVAGTGRPIVGADGNVPTYGPSKLYAHIDDYRLTTGVARYTSNFVPPEQLPTAA